MSTVCKLPILACSVVLLLPGCRSEEHPEVARNVVLLVGDTLRADRLGCYGYPRPTSPNIDALAARGTLYENCHSQANWTVPSMISMMSGLAVAQNDTQIPQSVAVLAEALQKRGIATIGITANPVLRFDRGFNRGFTRFDDADSLAAPDVAVQAIHRLEELPRRDGKLEPFFLWVQFIDPHDPYTPAAEHNLFSGPRPDADVIEARWRAARPQLAELKAPGGERPFEDSLAEMTAASNLYDGEVHQLDAGIGVLMAGLKRLGVLEDTLVILAADHGEILYEHETQPYFSADFVERAGGQPVGVEALFSLGHRPWYFEPLWNTPLILAGPGIPAGAKQLGLAANLDIFPTVLDFLGLPALPWLQGTSLADGNDPQRTQVHAYGQFTSAVLARDGLKLVLQPRRLYDMSNQNEPYVPTLFDVADGELANLAEQRPADVERLQVLIDEWKSANSREAIEELSARALEDLRRLGYVDGDKAPSED